MPGTIRGAPEARMPNLILLRTVIAAVIGGSILERLHVPAGALVGSALAVALLNSRGHTTTELPSWAQSIAFGAIGWMIGQGITVEVWRSLLDQVWAVAVAVGGLLFVGAVLALGAVKLGISDAATAFLATSPGGLSQMAALSAAVGADAALVATVHTIRIFAVVVISPIVLRALSGSGS